MVVPSELLVWFGFLVLGCQSVFENVDNTTTSTENITETTTENAILSKYISNNICLHYLRTYYKCTQENPFTRFNIPSRRYLHVYFFNVRDF